MEMILLCTGDTGAITTCDDCALPSPQIRGAAIVNNPCTVSSRTQDVSLSGELENSNNALGLD